MLTDYECVEGAAECSTLTPDQAAMKDAVEEAETK